MICVDSKNVVEMFENAKADIQDDRGGFQDLKSLIKSFPHISIVYINRSGNYDADNLAKQGRERATISKIWF